MKKKLLMMGLTGLSFLFSTKGFSQVPTASFSIDQQTTCVGSIIQITDASSDSPTSWIYAIQGFTAPVTIQNPTLSFNAAGSYTVILVASNSNGNSTPFTQTITVNALPSLTVSLPSAVCAGSSATLSASGAATYTWSNGTANGVGFIPSSTADYTVTGIDANSCTNTAVQSISVNPIPTLSVSGSNSVCSGALVTETVTGADTYLWLNSGATTNNISDNPLVSTDYSVTGTYTLTGCSVTVVKTLYVEVAPTLTASDATVCAGDMFIISASGAATYTYSTGSNTVFPTTNDSYTVTGSSPLGCTAPTSSAVINVTVNALPVITVSGGTVCAGSPFTLTPSGAVTYSYSGGSDVVSPTADESFTVTGTDANGCVSSIGAVADLTVSAVPALTITGTPSICVGATVTETVSGADTYVWSTTSTADNITDTPVSNITYSVTGTYTATGCSSATSKLVGVDAYPVITVSDATVCVNSAFTFSPSGAASYTYSNGSNTITPTVNDSYTITGSSPLGCTAPTSSAVINIAVNPLPTITVNSGTICAGNIFTITPSGALSYSYAGGSNTVNPNANQSYSVTGTDVNGCVSATVVSNIAVNALPTVVVGSGTVCAGSVYSITASVTSPNATTLNFSNGSCTVIPTSNSSYTVTVIDANGCISTPAVSSVTVNSTPTVAVNSGSVCAGNVFTITASGATTYTYSNGSNTVSPTANTSYTVNGTDANGCVSANVISNVTVNALPTINVTMASATICAGETILLTSSGAVSYLWNSGQTTATLNITPNTTTSYTVTGTDANGCDNKTTITENVDACLGISEHSNNIEVNIYPNPNNGTFTVKVVQATSIKVISLVGQTVYTAELTEGENAVSLNEQITGVYFVQLKQGNMIKTMKVIKN